MGVKESNYIQNSSLQEKVVNQGWLPKWHQEKVMHLWIKVLYSCYLIDGLNNCYFISIYTIINVNFASIPSESTFYNNGFITNCTINILLNIFLARSAITGAACAGSGMLNSKFLALQHRLNLNASAHCSTQTVLKDVYPTLVIGQFYSGMCVSCVSAWIK